METTKKTLAEAILAVMEDVEWVAKSMTVWTGTNSYKWVSDKEVRIIMRESMIKNWLVILPIGITPTIQVDRWEEDDTYNKQPPYPKKSKQSVFTEVVTKYMLIHSSGEKIELAWYGQWVDTQDKGAGKATTYALKNTLLNMFLVPTGVDTDDTHSDDLPTPPKKTVDTPSGWTKPKTLTSTNEYCPECGEQCKTKKWLTKDGRPYELGECKQCNVKFFVNRKDLSDQPF